MVIESLGKTFPEYEFITQKITTQGDRIKDWPLVRLDKGIFVKEIEDALLSNKIDIAVHSMKDMPTEIPQGLKLTAVTRRINPLDVVIAKNWWF